MSAAKHFIFIGMVWVALPMGLWMARLLVAQELGIVPPNSRSGAIVRRVAPGCLPKDGKREVSQRWWAKPAESDEAGGARGDVQGAL
jgi:hypothetical protein